MLGTRESQEVKRIVVLRDYNVNYKKWRREVGKDFTRGVEVLLTIEFWVVGSGRHGLKVTTIRGVLMIWLEV